MGHGTEWESGEQNDKKSVEQNCRVNLMSILMWKLMCKPNELNYDKIDERNSEEIVEQIDE